MGKLGIAAYGYLRGVSTESNLRDLRHIDGRKLLFLTLRRPIDVLQNRQKISSPTSEVLQAWQNSMTLDTNISCIYL